MMHYFEPSLHLTTFVKQSSNDADDPTDQGPDHNLDTADDQDDARPPPRFSPTTLRHSPSPEDDGPPTHTTRPNIKREHFLVLNTILHKCVHDHDYSRAARALGLLLRFEVHGHRIDLRSRGLWDLAGHILLHQHRILTPLDDDTRDTDAEGDRDPPRHVFNPQRDAPSTWFTDAGFAAAQTLFDRLALQYPHNRYRARAVDARAFFPPFIGVWIFRVQARAERALAALWEVAAGEERDAQVRRVRAEELVEARRIRERVEELTTASPYDRDAEVQKLHGMCLRWEADLVVVTEGHRAATRVARSRVRAAKAFRRAKELGADVEGWDVGVEEEGDEDEEMED